MSLPVGMISPIWENEIHVPKHQTVEIFTAIKMDSVDYSIDHQKWFGKMMIQLNRLNHFNGFNSMIQMENDDTKNT